MAAPWKLGLALSGGGSRAMAFHRGTLRALDELGLIEAVDVVSTVSGGSVFGASWLCAIADGKSTAGFLDDLAARLRRGFIVPALLSPRALKMLLPGTNRTHRLAETFDELLTGSRRLDELPGRPLLCMNTSVLNHAEVGRFSQLGFSCKAVGQPQPSGSYPQTKVPVTVGFAAAASAAFPFGLPPVTLPAAWLPRFEKGIAGHRKLLLTDGGVIENLGAQALLRSGTFGCERIVLSDAGTPDVPWRPTLAGHIKNFVLFALSRETLARLLAVMNEKQNKSMRQIVMRDAAAVATPPRARALWVLRVNQSWDDFLTGISRARRARLAGQGQPFPADTAPAHEVSGFLQAHGVDLGPARRRYDEMGGDGSAEAAKSVPTGFSGLPGATISLLERHAMWQVQACHAVYGPMIEAPSAAVG